MDYVCKTARFSCFFSAFTPQNAPRSQAETRNLAGINIGRPKQRGLSHQTGERPCSRPLRTERAPIGQILRDASLSLADGGVTERLQLRLASEDQWQRTALIRAPGETSPGLQELNAAGTKPMKVLWPVFSRTYCLIAHWNCTANVVWLFLCLEWQRCKSP